MTPRWFTLTDGLDADFGVDGWHGTNAFIRDGDRIFRTYFVNSRGDETMGSTWSYLWHDEAAQPGADRPGLRQLRAAGAASTGGDGA
jgi:predicted dithiol-disulfide oxidoreductase (DUF899 family)